MEKRNLKKIKIIGCCAMMLAFMSCGSKKEQTAAPIYNVPQDVTLVQGNGKVMPLHGLLNLSTETAGKVLVVHVKNGDVVHQGDVLLELDDTNAKLKYEQAISDVKQQKENIKLAETALKKSRIEYTLAEKMFKVSVELVERGGDSKRNLMDRHEKALQAEQVVKQNEQQIALEKMKLKNMQESEKLALNTLNDCKLIAPSDGKVLQVDVAAGSTIQPYTQLITFSPKEPVVVEAEIDELFAPLMKIGQKVDITLMGYQNNIATGKVVELEDLLTNKSIFSGLDNEQSDRQVRKVRIMLDDQEHTPLIGTKVTCDIHIEK